MEPKSDSPTNQRSNTEQAIEPEPSDDLGHVGILEDYRYSGGEHTLFEKVLATANRAKDIHNEGRIPLVETPFSKAPLIALVELKQGKIVVDKLDPQQLEADPNPKIKSAPSTASKIHFPHK